MTVTVKTTAAGPLAVQAKRLCPGRIPVGQGDCRKRILVYQYGRLVMDAGHEESCSARVGLPAWDSSQQVQAQQLAALDRCHKHRVSGNSDRTVNPALVVRGGTTDGDRSANGTTPRGIIERILVTPEQGMAGNIDCDHGPCRRRADQDPVGKRRAGTGKTPQAIHQDRARFHVSELLGPLQLPGTGIENHQAYFPVEFRHAVELSVERKRGAEEKSARQAGLVLATLATHHPQQASLGLQVQGGELVEGLGLSTLALGNPRRADHHHHLGIGTRVGIAHVP